MQARDKKNSTATIARFLEANATLAVLKTISVLPTQPPHVIMRYQQAVLAHEPPAFMSAFQAAKNIAMSSNQKRIALQPFFRGAQPGLAKEFLKSMVYKGALITGAPDLADQALAYMRVTDVASPGQYSFARSLTAGAIAASGDVVFGGALESWATHRATSQGKDAHSSFIKEVRAAKSPLEKIQRAYRGAGPATLKGMVAFTTYFATKEPIQAQITELYGVKKLHDAPWHAKLLSAVCSGGAVALTSAPFDVVKTQAQMPGTRNLSTLASLGRNLKLFGIKGVTAGLPLKVVMVAMGWAINDVAVQKVSHQPSR